VTVDHIFQLCTCLPVPFSIGSSTASSAVGLPSFSIRRITSFLNTMMFTSAVFASFTALFCTSFSFVGARIVQRDVVSPPITSPTAGTVWNVNERHNVTWDTSVIPPGTNNTGMIVLGFVDANDPYNEHLDLNDPLAKGFPITAGRALITVPSVQTRDSYILVLFGDSGNASPKFTINNISITASPSTSTSAASSPVSSPASASITAPQQATSSEASSPASIPQPLSSTANSVVSGSPAAASAHVTSNSLSAASSAASAASTAQAQPAAFQSATSSNAGVRSTSYGGAVTWISTICSLVFALGFSL